MSDQSDSQNRSAEHIHMSEGTSPSSTSYEGSRSTPSNLPKAATRQRKERVKKTMARVVGQPSMMEEEELSAPAPKALAYG